MLYIVWEFIVKPECVAEFERIYGPDGTWAKLFRQGAGYQKTLLTRDLKNPRTYLLIDIWDTQESFDRFKAAHAAEYHALDKECEALTEREVCIGYFEDIDSIPKCQQ